MPDDAIDLAEADSRFVALWRNHVDAVKRESQDRKDTVRRVIDAYVACAGQLDGPGGSDLDRIADAAGSPHAMVAAAGCECLERLARGHEAARHVFRTMCRSPKMAARFNAVAYLSWTLPEPLRREVVTAALGDRSAKVRIKGIERAFDFRFRDMLPALTSMIDVESDPKVRRTLDLHVALFRDGYRLCRSSEGYTITFSPMPGLLTGELVHTEEPPGEEEIRRVIDESKAPEFSMYRERHEWLRSLGWRGD